MSEEGVRAEAGGAWATGAATATDGAVAPELARRFAAEVAADPLVRATANAIRKNGVQAVALDQDVVASRPYTFSHEIETGPITHQKKSGRCWMFAGLNALRVAVMRRCNMKEFELSQAYPMFWDKFERSNYFLEAIIETRDEDLHGRLVAWLLDAPLEDGGQWDMFVNLVEKYGVVPKYAMPESFHSSDSAGMNRVLTLKLREYAKRLRDLHHERGASLAELRAEKERMLREVYGMLVRFLGEPPSRFDFEYRDKDGGFHRDPDLTPQEFLRAYVDLDLAEYVSLIHAPTADKPYGRTYTVRFLGNVKGGRDVLYLNVPIETLKEAALRQLLDGEPVWFGCDVGKMSDRASGVLDGRLYDYEGVLGVPFALDKAGRLDYGESRMTHAMVFTGVNVVDGRPTRWKVENSWGTEFGHQGFFVMSDDWFDEYMYQVVVKRRYLPPELLAALAEPPIQLPPWDPMGSLAH